MKRQKHGARLEAVIWLVAGILLTAAMWSQEANAFTPSQAQPTVTDTCGRPVDSHGNVDYGTQNGAVYKSPEYCTAHRKNVAERLEMEKAESFNTWTNILIGAAVVIILFTSVGWRKHNE